VEISYPALQEALNADPTPAAVFEAVCRIRREKLPDPVQIPNCGSFFKNPVVPWSQYESLLQCHPDIPSYSFGSPDQPQRKLAAAWLIDRAGWKGRSFGGARVHDRQALVLTNPGRRDADAVLALAREIQISVQQTFGVALELEPERIGF
jgi:UDP-N-acetylmuramate dehydrogenase